MTSIEKAWELTRFFQKKSKEQILSREKRQRANRKKQRKHRKRFKRTYKQGSGK